MWNDKLQTTLSDNFVSGKVAFSHPQLRKSTYTPNDNSLSKEYLATLVFKVSNLTSGIFTFKKNISSEKNNSYGRNNFPIGNIENPIGIWHYYPAQC